MTTKTELLPGSASYTPLASLICPSQTRLQTPVSGTTATGMPQHGKYEKQSGKKYTTAAKALIITTGALMASTTGLCKDNPI